MPDWKSCEGQVLDGKYPLERFYAAHADSALFLTASGRLAIRIARIDDPVEAAELVGRWNRVKRFPHPHLIAIESAGTADLCGGPVAWLVMEHAEENLDDVLRSRSLTPDEARAMLLPVAAALDYLHRRGLVHGAVKPSHIFAIGDTVKLSSESIAEGDPAADIESLATLAVDALPPNSLPRPFAGIVAGCLDPDPARRWTADQVVARLRSAEAATEPSPSTPARRPVSRLAAPAAVGAVAVGVLMGVMFTRSSDAPAPTRAVDNPRPEPAAVTAPVERPPTPKPTPRPTNESSRDRLVTEDGIVRREMPQIPSKARSTITGSPTVVARVKVDPAGNVTDAAIERTFSPYFGKLALEAARKWKFVSDERAASREWLLRFDFTRTNTQASASRVGQ